MSPIQTSAEVLRSEKISNDIFRITLQAESIASSAAPGQFVMVRATDKVNGQPLLRRPFSIHQTTAAGTLQILFKKIGPGTDFLSTRHPGDTLNLVGPLGSGFSLPEQPANICLVGGGMGVAPLFFLTKHVIARLSPDQQIKILLGAVTANEIVVLQNDFENLGVPVHVATDDGSAGHHGLVTELLDRTIEPGNQWHVFTCGPHPMMNAVATYCRQKNWPCQVSLETLMACGISACLGCAVKSARQESGDKEPYLHVCKDGPVFDSGEIAW